MFINVVSYKKIIIIIFQLKNESQIEQVFFGFFYSSEVAFTTYLYAKVDDKQYYQKITSSVKASMLSGRFLSVLIAQIIISTHALNEAYLVYISIFSR